MRKIVLAVLAVLASALSACGTVEPPKKVEWIVAPPGAVAPLVAAEVARADAGHRQLLVYVGATWCEPCRRFHEAVQAGKLDAQLGSLRLVEFDLDRDAARLKDAGYDPKLIPLLALPNSDGHASGRQMEGSVKGDGAVDQMVPRLLALIAR